MSNETKKCPCCESALKERVSIDGLTLVHECQTWGCLFRCNDAMVDKIAAAMKAQAELDVLKAAVKYVCNSEYARYTDDGVGGDALCYALDELAKLVME